MGPPSPPGETPPLINEAPAEDYTNSESRFRGLTTKFALKARTKTYESFLQTLKPTAETTIVDIGATPDALNEDSNFLEKWYPHPERITATSIEDARTWKRRIPA
jgi:hypothetical protein